jgi:hypothetical protein
MALASAYNCTGTMRYYSCNAGNTFLYCQASATGSGLSSDNVDGLEQIWFLLLCLLQFLERLDAERVAAEE